MNTKNSINDVLDILKFTLIEKEGFVDCIKAVKQEQKDDSFHAEEEIYRIVKETTEK